MSQGVVDELENENKSMVTLSVDKLKVGITCGNPLLDETGVLLLGEGAAITEEVIAGLMDRGIQEISVHPDDARRMAGEAPRPKVVAPRSRTEPRAPSGQHPSTWRPGVPLKAALVDRRGQRLDSGRTQQLSENLAAARGSFEVLQMQVTSQKMQTIQAVSELSNAFAMSIVDDHDQTVGELVRPSGVYSLTDRSVKLSVLGMAVATEMSLDGPGVLEVGTAGLLHDVGLYSMEPELSCPGRKPLTDQQMWEFRKHPIESANALRDVSDVPHSVLMAIEQVHEQHNGSGYPFGIEGKRIHVYARILNVCDTFLQLTMGTAYRKALVPHDAMGLLLHQARYGLFDPKVIHAFLRTESLFPLGSRVELSNGRTADVIRRPLHGYASPVLQDDQGDLVDMNDTSIEIVRPLPDDNCDQVRLSVDEMQSLHWNPSDELVLADH